MTQILCTDRIDRRKAIDDALGRVLGPGSWQCSSWKPRPGSGVEVEARLEGEWLHLRSGTIADVDPLWAVDQSAAPSPFVRWAIEPREVLPRLVADVAIPTAGSGDEALVSAAESMRAALAGRHPQRSTTGSRGRASIQRQIPDPSRPCNDGTSTSMMLSALALEDGWCVSTESANGGECFILLDELYDIKAALTVSDGLVHAATRLFLDPPAAPVCRLALSVFLLRLAAQVRLVRAVVGPDDEVLLEAIAPAGDRRAVTMALEALAAAVNAARDGTLVLATAPAVAAAYLEQTFVRPGTDEDLPAERKELRVVGR